MLCGLIRPTSGQAFVDGLEIGKEPDITKIRGRIGLLPEVPGLHESLTPYQILDFFGKLYGLDVARRQKNIEGLLKLLELWDRRNDQVSTFSKGMAQKVAIARALVHEPKIIFLDEPTAALDPMMAKTIRDLILHLKSEGKTVFITTHNLLEAERICDRVAIFSGKLIDVGTPTELARKHFARRTIIQLDLKGGAEEHAKAFVKAIESIKGVLKVSFDNDILLVDVDDPDVRNPEIVARLVAERASIRFVSEKTYSLEDVYLKVMGRRIDDMSSVFEAHPKLVVQPPVGQTAPVQPQFPLEGPKGGAAP